MELFYILKAKNLEWMYILPEMKWRDQNDLSEILYTDPRKKIHFHIKALKFWFTFRVKLSDSIFFLLGLSPIVKLIWHEKQIFLSILLGKYCLIHLEIVKRHKKGNYNVEIIFKTR